MNDLGKWYYNNLLKREGQQFDPINGACFSKDDYSIEVILPDCTNQGYTTYICANCGDNYNSDFEEAIGPVYTE